MKTFRFNKDNISSFGSTRTKPKNAILRQLTLEEKQAFFKLRSFLSEIPESAYFTDNGIKEAYIL